MDAGYQGIRISGYQGIRVSGYQEEGYLLISDLRFQIAD
jgi:hypothetical protein